MLAGPGTFRLFVQPAIALALGVLHGLRDYRAGRLPYLLELYQVRADRSRRLREGLHDVIIPFLIAVAVSMVLQFIVRSYIRFGFALAYAILFVAIPYFVTRALTNRIARRSSAGRARGLSA
jgi:hypothetical protein